uniref:Uncharacterized protein n=1 Tax=Arundo donax TaxID=35708 RepID=A0A0A9GXC4_ARUDO
MIKDEIKQVMDLVVECGASEGSVEWLMACQLFVKAENRHVFLQAKTDEGRLSYLRMWCSCMA